MIYVHNGKSMSIHTSTHEADRRIMYLLSGAYDWLPPIIITYYQSDCLLCQPLLHYRIPDHLTTLPSDYIFVSSNICPISMTTSKFLVWLLRDCPDYSAVLLLPSDKSVFIVCDRSGSGRVFFHCLNNRVNQQKYHMALVQTLNHNFDTAKLWSWKKLSKDLLSRAKAKTVTTGRIRV
jgi:hypothetical protein